MVALDLPVVKGESSPLHLLERNRVAEEVVGCENDVRSASRPRTGLDTAPGLTEVGCEAGLCEGVGDELWVKRSVPAQRQTQADPTLALVYCP